MLEANLTAERIRAVLEVLPNLLEDNSARKVFVDSLDDKGELKNLIADYFRLMDIAHFIRRGGVKAMIYRLETGHTECEIEDYFDQTTKDLMANCSQQVREKLNRQASLIEKLESISPCEEAAVTMVMPELDAILLKHSAQGMHGGA